MLRVLPELKEPPCQASALEGPPAGPGREDADRSERLMWTAWLGRLSLELKLKASNEEGPLIPILLK